MTLALALALGLGAPAAGLTPPSGTLSRLPPAPVQVFRIAWQRPVVKAATLEAAPLETGGVAVDPATGTVIFGTRDGWIHALREDGSVLWELETNGPVTGTPLVDGDVVYVGGADGKLRALHLPTGKVRWTYDAREDLGTEPVLANGVLYVASLQDTLFAVDARTGAWKWHHRRAATRTGFAVHGAARALVRDTTVFAAYSDGHVLALDAATGTPRWDRFVAPVGDPLDVDALALQGNRLYAAAYSGALLALDPADGKVQWTFRAPGLCRVTATGGTVVAASSDQVHGLAAETGAALWSAPLGGISASAGPVLAGGWLVVPAGRAGLEFRELRSGRLIRVLQPGTGVDATPAALGQRLYVLSNGGDLFALDLS